ncbi:MAG: hypothetical protein LBQ62_08925, partial [Candidatus Accumulibacter sp.]|nr:hypothetical protein [Accumulibacter sp.]
MSDMKWRARGSDRYSNRRPVDFDGQRLRYLTYSGARRPTVIWRRVHDNPKESSMKKTRRAILKATLLSATLASIGLAPLGVL